MADRCTARSKTSGEQCKKPAIPGGKTCRIHGSATSNARRKAAGRVLEQQVREAYDRYQPSAQPVSDPFTALLKVAGEITGLKDFLGEQVSEMRADLWRYEGEHAEQLNALVAMYERLLTQTARVLVDISKLGLEERLVRLREEQARALMTVFEAVLGELDLSLEQRERAPDVMRRHLRTITGEAA